MDNIKNLLKRIMPAEMESAGIIRPAKKGGYICPNCGNGNGKDGTGIIPGELANGYEYHCFKCDKSFDNIGLLANYFNLDATKDFTEIVKRGSEMFNLSGRIETNAFPSMETRSVTPKTESTEPKYKGFIQQCNQNLEKLPDTQNARRGLTLETLKKFFCGYASKWGINKTPRLIIPSNFNHYLARDIRENVPKDQQSEIKMHAGKKSIFGCKTLDTTDGAAFLVEGEIDAMSIWQVSGLPVVAISGSAITEEMEKQFQKIPAREFIVMLDSDETGKTHADKVVATLKSAGHNAIKIDFTDKYKDANEFLQADSAGLTKYIKSVYRDAQKAFKDGLRAESANVFDDSEQVSIGKFFSEMFDNEIALTEKFKDRKIGFANIDEKQIFLPGVYVLGGLPGVGKSTFAWQIADNLAFNGENVLYLAGENSKTEFFLKSVTRRLYRKGKTDLTVSAIRTGKGKDNSAMKEIIEEIKRSEINLQVYEFKAEGIDKIIDRLQNFINSCNNGKPITIFVDYLQLFAAGASDARLAVDETVRKLKILQIKTQITLFIISSFNRQNYTQEVNFESFKESGGVEYTADTVFGLQLYLGDEARNILSIKRATQQKPRLLQLCCIKNRNGGTYDVNFKYFSAYDYFEPDQSVDKVEDSDCVMKF